MADSRVDARAIASATIEALRTRAAKVALIGQGYVGLPLALRAQVVGYDVVGFDTDAGRVRALAEGSSYVGDVSDAELQASLKAGYRPTADPAQLAGFDDKEIHAPWLTSPQRQQEARCVIGVDYPAPVVDHAQARARTLARFAAVRRA